MRKDNVQQARPTTEQARESLKTIIRDFYLNTECEELDYKQLYLMNHPNAKAIPMTDVFEPLVEKCADQILSLLPFPDEQGIRWVDRPDKSGQWWVSPLVLNDAQTEYRYISPRIMRVIDYQRSDRSLEVDYDRDSIPVDKFVEEYYPDSRWLFIPEPSVAFLKAGDPPQGGEK